MARRAFNSTGGGGSGGSGGSTGSRDYLDLIGDDSAGGSSGSSDPFDEGSTGSEVISSGGDETRARSTGSSSGSDDATATPSPTADDDRDGSVQDVDDERTGASKEIDRDMEKARQEAEKTAEAVAGDRAERQTNAGTPGGVNRRTAEQILRQERAADTPAQDFAGIGTLLPTERPDGFGELGGQDESVGEQFARDLSREGAEFGGDVAEGLVEELGGKPITGDRRETIRTFGAAAGGTPGDVGTLALEGFDAATFVATGNERADAADNAVLRAGQVADTVVNAGVQGADRRIRIDESAQFDDESLRFKEPVVEVEPAQRGEFAGEVSFTAASAVAGGAAGSRLGAGSDLSGRVLKGGAKAGNRGVNSLLDAPGRVRNSQFLQDTRGGADLTGLDGSSRSGGSGGSSSTGTSGGGGFDADPDLLDDSLTQNQDFLSDLAQRERSAGSDLSDDPGMIRPGDNSGGVGNTPTAGGELGGRGSGSLLDADLLDSRGKRTGDSRPRDRVDEKLDDDSVSNFFGKNRPDGTDSRRNTLAEQTDADRLTDQFSVTGAGVSLGVGVGTGTGGDTDTGPDSVLDGQLDTRTRRDTDTDTRPDNRNILDVDTRTDTRTDNDNRQNTGRGDTDTPLRFDTDTPARLDSAFGPTPDTPVRVDEFDTSDSSDDRRRRRSDPFDVASGEFEQDIFTPGEVLSGEALSVDLDDDLGGL